MRGVTRPCASSVGSRDKSVRGRYGRRREMQHGPYIRRGAGCGAQAAHRRHERCVYAYLLPPLRVADQDGPCVSLPAMDLTGVRSLQPRSIQAFMAVGAYVRAAGEAGLKVKSTGRRREGGRQATRVRIKRG